MKRRCVAPIHRSGSMLIELCASLATASMVMLLGVTLIERSMHWTQAVHRHTNLQRELSQLASAWREDCSKADQIRFESERQVILSTAGKEVIYQIQEDRIERRCKWKDPQLATACTPEDYPLGIGYQAKFNSPYLVIYMIDPVGQIASTRLRVLGKTAQKPYRILEDKP